MEPRGPRTTPSRSLQVGNTRLATTGLRPQRDRQAVPLPTHAVETSTTSTASQVRRKPAPLQLITSSVRGGKAEGLLSIKKQKHPDSRRTTSVDSTKLPGPPSATDSSFAPRDLDQFPHGDSPLKKSQRRNLSLDGSPPTSSEPRLLNIPGTGKESNLPRPLAITAISSAQNSTLSYSASEYENEPQYSQHSRRSSMMTEFAPVTPYAPATPLTLLANGLSAKNNPQRSTVEQASMSKSPISPSSKLSSFFSWKQATQQPGHISPATTFSERSNSPNTPPRSPVLDETVPDDIRSSTSSTGPSNPQQQDYFASTTEFPAKPSSVTGKQFDDLFHELREVSAELASSIRREMELEDEVERFQTEAPNTQPDLSRRTSDYYSDSSVSQAIYPLIPVSETKIQGLEKMRRKAEQEKAQLRWEMTQRVQDNIINHKALQLHVQSLEEQLQARGSSQSTEKERELEATLEDLKRRLNEEKQLKENFEDLLAGMREEIESHKNERDNLRDEVVPQLRARVEGLETEAVEMQKLTYDYTRMQQDLQNLKNENQALVNARKLQLDLQQGSRFKSIPEDDDSPLSPQLNRPNSLTRNKSLRSQASPISKSLSPSQGHFDVSQAVKDVEDQRDALQNTMKFLLIRQDLQQKRHAKEVRALKKERDDALSTRARRAGFNVEVRNLRLEVNNLRQRADEAMEQKWQCEKGLSGLKMDLDRAKQETSSLRELLKEHDIFIPDSISTPTHIRTQESLEQAYEDLRIAHSDSMFRLRSGTVTTSHRPASLEAAEARMEALSTQVQQQLKSNNELRERLAEAIGRGEQEQDSSAKKITELQNKLKTVEDQLMAAQQHSEDSIAEHEGHVKELKDSQITRSQRGISRSWTSLGIPPGGLKSPFFDGKAPKLSRTTTGPGISVAEAGKTVALEQKVKDLEATAVQAEEEMQGVVERMNKAQIEVAELQAERDEAMRQTRRLQREIEEERERAKALVS